MKADDHELFWAWREERHTRWVTVYVNGHSEQREEVYYLNYVFCKLRSARYAGYQTIEFGPSSLFMRESANKGYYQTESIEFNKEFYVRGNDQMQVVKTFTPSVITNILDLGKKAYAGTKVTFSDGEISTYRTYESNVYGDNELKKLSISGSTEEKILGSISKKMAQDFRHLFANIELLSPFKTTTI